MFSPSKLELEERSRFVKLGVDELLMFEASKWGKIMYVQVSNGCIYRQQGQRSAASRGHQRPGAGKYYFNGMAVARFDSCFPFDFLV